MKRTILLYIFICILSVFGLYSQRKHGLMGHSSGDGYSIFTIGAGPAYLFGDVGGTMRSGMSKGTTFNPASTREMVSLGYRYIFPNNLSIKINLLYGDFYGNDSLTNLQERRYSFTSKIFEGSLQGELYLIGGPQEIASTRHSLYLFAGGGLVIPQPKLIGYRPGDIISDSIKTNPVTPILPFGIGYDYYIGKGLSVGGEFAFRYAFGDFLDGLKTPYSDNNDVIVNISITLSYNFSLGSPYR